MTELRSEGVLPALQAVRAELLRRARDDARRTIDDARREADRIVEEASDTARAVTQKAQAAGEVAGARAVAAQSAALQRALRHEVLIAQHEAYQRWREEAARSVQGLRDDPDFPTWHRALRAIAHDALGEDARVTDAADGGVVAENGRRRLDLSLSAIAGRAIDEIAPQVDGLWS